MGFPLKAGIHSKYTERIRSFKYRQGNRRTGEHPRDRLSIQILAVEANAEFYENGRICTKQDSNAQTKSDLYSFFNVF